MLRPSGRLATTIGPRDRVLAEHPAPPADLFRTYSGEQVAQCVVAAGFSGVRIETCPAPQQFPGLAVVGWAGHEP